MLDLIKKDKRGLLLLVFSVAWASYTILYSMNSLKEGIVNKVQASALMTLITVIDLLMSIFIVYLISNKFFKQKTGTKQRILLCSFFFMVCLWFTLQLGVRL